MHDLHIYNTLTRRKEPFQPLNPPHVGMYVCGPTLYTHAHLGNCRTFLSFDIVFRYLRHLGYKVRYVRNITDVGHLESDADEGEDKVAKRARLEKLEPMEIVQFYAVDFHRILDKLNLLPPSIEPLASGHIPEQIEMTQRILQNGMAYEVNGTVWFDVEKFAKVFPYTQLSNRQLDELLDGTRDNLEGQDEKRGRLDFALWKRATPGHIMRWNSPWGVGFPGWHIECSAMSTKYLGEEFDIHGGGMDLIPTHHTNEIAQHAACYHKNPARYWMHTNMLTVNGQKMSKSLGNSFLPAELFSGNHPLLERGYSPMVVRFFMLQAHYRSTLDFSNFAIQAAEKGFQRLMAALELIPHLPVSDTSTVDVPALRQAVYRAMNDDFNTPVALAELFEGVRHIYAIHEGRDTLTAADKEQLQKLYNEMVFDVLGLKPEKNSDDTLVTGLMQLILDIRSEVRSKKDYATSDKIRDALAKLGIQVKDGKEGTTWSRT
ncbi:MAG: cysteine--tRNA ligase [Chitinophagales bacterium]|nr:cysteine--tRNA ligase [Chitinophagales bacterium]MDW8419087.1 cysteine--tRNA ligase [Chitinophagales bacterium]